MNHSLEAYLTHLAENIANAYQASTFPDAILLTGSVVDGQCDSFSDLDIIMYYEKLVPPEQAASARQQLQAQDFFFISQPGDDGFMEDYHVNGVECQVAHIPISVWEHDMDEVLVNLDVVSPRQKALSGLLSGHPLHGQAIIQRWQRRAKDYPDALARAMIDHHFHFFPLWYREDMLRNRDATLWVHQMLVETGFHILGALAGLNRQYYSAFQFKRMRRFVSTLQKAPINLVGRLERLLDEDMHLAIGEAEQLVQDCVVLINTSMPEIDTTAIQRRLGQRQQSWEPPKM
jgi:hypothetical protein